MYIYIYWELIHWSLYIYMCITVKLYIYIYDMCLEPQNVVATWLPWERIQHFRYPQQYPAISLPTCSRKWQNKLLDKTVLSTFVTGFFIQETLHILRHAKPVALKPLPVRISQFFTSVDGYNGVALIRRDQGKSWNGSKAQTFDRKTAGFPQPMEVWSLVQTIVQFLGMIQFRFHV